MVKLQLEVKNEDNSISKQQVEIVEVNIRQLTQVIKVIKDVIGLAKDDDNLQALLAELFDEAEAEIVKGDKSEAEKEAQFGDNLTKHITGALDVLLMEIPDKVIELLSALSGIDSDLLMDQKADVAFDLYDAVIEVNDVDMIIQRAKKSLKLTRAQLKVMNLFNPKLVPEAPKQA